ncbi:HAMP domain-containing sensor histidine kinase [Steroidobacter cummioxidans]|uniref:HAMP domain-containing sensor histidine kinase n=1 Tax=Steroidobacter cummioxidans TaxID=1803913 RepID=UPI000E3244BE|nr:ATP-binding protein [Steroidobacter cummioxidans]
MRRLIPRSTLGLAALISIIVCGFTIATGYVSRYAAHEELERQLDRRIADEAALLIQEYTTGGVVALIAALERRDGQHTANGMGYLLVAADGMRIAGELEIAVPKPGWTESLSVQSKAGTHRAHALTSVLAGGERLVVAADREPVEEIDATIKKITLGTSAVMGLISVGGAWLFGVLLSRRIQRLNNVALAIIDGDLEQRMPRDRSAGELDVLAGTLNRMLDRNAELLLNLRQVSTDIAHDLRTPLGRQQQVLELALAECKDAADYRHAIEQARRIGEQALQLFSALLDISEIESLELRASFVPVNLSELARRVVEAFAPDAEAGNRKLQAAVADGIEIHGHAQLLSQLLVNLVENAMRHTPPGTCIQVCLQSQLGRPQLMVEDDGPGIPSSDRPRVLERFVRLERSRSTPGHGLGLSLVHAIVKAHQADLRLEDAHPGLRILISF